MRLRVVVLSFLTAAFALCHFLLPSQAQQAAATTGIPATNKVPSTVRSQQIPGIENFFQLNERVYSGSQPEGDAAFAALKAKGIKTIISVDGAKPDVETAKKFGLQYVHLPVGYDGVPTNQALRIVKAAESLPGPIFVHCHHGLHRGPAGAAVICMTEDGWTGEQAEAWMHLAGTATNYMGLYKTVAAFKPPSADVLKAMPSAFPEKSAVSPLADTMIEIDNRFDSVKAVRKAGFKILADHPNMDPANEALLLHELFKELLRSPEMEKHNADFKAKLTATEEAVNSFHLALRATPVDYQKVEQKYQLINDSCAACHKVFRN